MLNIAADNRRRALAIGLIVTALVFGGLLLLSPPHRPPQLAVLRALRDEGSVLVHCQGQQGQAMSLEWQRAADDWSRLDPAALSVGTRADTIIAAFRIPAPPAQPFSYRLCTDGLWHGSYRSQVLTVPVVIDQQAVWLEKRLYEQILPVDPIERLQGIQSALSEGRRPADVLLATEALRQWTDAVCRLPARQQSVVFTDLPPSLVENANTSQETRRAVESFASYVASKRHGLHSLLTDHRGHRRLLGKRDKVMDCLLSCWLLHGRQVMVELLNSPAARELTRPIGWRARNRQERARLRRRQARALLNHLARELPHE